MRILAIFFFLMLSLGCQTSPLPSPSQSPHAQEENDHDHEEHAKEETLTLTASQVKELKIRSQAVVYATGAKADVRPGRIEADPKRQAVLSSQVSGTLQQIFVQVGDELRAGSKVAVMACPEVTALQADFHESEVEAELAGKELENKTQLLEVGDDIKRPLEAAKLEVAQANAQRDSAKAKLQSGTLKNERLETLLQEGIASRQQVEESRADKRALEADFEQAEFSLTIAKNHLERERRISESRLNIKAETFPAEARLARARERMKHSRERLQQIGADPEDHTGLITLTSPIAGTLVEGKASIGELVEGGAPIAVVVDSSKVWVWIDLQRADLPFVEKGSPITLSLLEQSDKKVEAHLDYIAPELDKQSQTLRARAVLVDPPPGFRIGSFVNAHLGAGGGEAKPAIPQKAVQVVEGQTVVYLQLSQAYRRTPVTLGESIDKDLVTVEGLQVGDRVVVEGAEQLKSLDLESKIGGHSH